MPELVFRGVERVFPPLRGGPPTRALSPTDLTVGDGEFVALLGPSGCGKSTLLRIAAGLDEATAGTVTLDGEPITGPGPDRGMVFQSYTLFPWLSVAQNVAFGPRQRGVGAREAAAMAAPWLERVGLSDFAGHLPKQLSGGMQQRVALARALANDPKVLLLDEPFGALDHQTRGLMQELLLRVWGEGQAEGRAARKTVLFVTHDIEEAAYLATRVAVMTARPGRLKREVVVPFPYPRSYRLKTAPEFVALEAALTEELRAEAIEAAALAP